MTPTVQTDKMIAEKADGIGWMTFNNPARHNALSMDMWQAIPAILDAFAADDDVRIVVMRGAGGKAFISGADISEFEEKRSSAQARQAYDRAGAEAFAAFGRLAKPVVAMLHGYCIGGGLAMALQADIRIASERARFGIPAARLGLGYGFAGLQALVALVGPAYANEIMFSARRFDAEEAWRMGLVNRVVESAELESAVRELASTIASNAPLTIRAAKEAVRQALRDPDQRDLSRCHELVEACYQSEDYVEGRRAFMEKREPRFKGR